MRAHFGYPFPGGRLYTCKTSELVTLRREGRREGQKETETERERERERERGKGGRRRRRRRGKNNAGANAVNEEDLERDSATQV